MTQPFCCDIKSGSIEEQNEFKRLHREVCYKFNGGTYSYVIEYFGIDEEGTPLGLSYEDEKLVKKWFNNNILPLSEGILILKKMIGEEESTQEDISVYIKTIRINFEMWQKGEIKDGAFSWHLQNNLLHIEKILQPKP